MLHIFNEFNPFNKTEKHTLREWETYTGIKILAAKDYKISKNKIPTNLYTRRAFKRLLKCSTITCKTEKGLEFLSLL